VYTLTLPEGDLPAALIDEMRAWLDQNLPLAVRAQGGAVWYLFSDPALHAVATQRLRQEPGTPLFGYATIWVRPAQVDMETVCDPETDQALYAFTKWAQSRAPLVLKDSGMEIPAADLTDPELYE
jgi:hypothetical protein